MTYFPTRHKLIPVSLGMHEERPDVPQWVCLACRKTMEWSPKPYGCKGSEVNQ